MQKELLTGFLACDLVGFHTDEYERNFLECCRRGLEVKINRDDIEYRGHKSHTGSFIVGINPQKLENSLKDKDVQEMARELEEEYQQKTVI